MFLLSNQIIIILEIEYVVIENDMGIMCLIEYLCLIWHIIPLLLSLFLNAIFMPRGPPKSSEINEFLGGFYYV